MSHKTEPDQLITVVTQGSMNHHSINVSGEDEMSDGVPSSPESQDYGDNDILSASGVNDHVTAQLAAAGPIGVAAAAAIASAKKRKRPHTFETNPSIRKRQQTRLLRKLKLTIDEYATRVGQQAVVLICTPGKPQNSFKVFGAKPLEDVVRSCRSMVMSELEQVLAQQAPPPTQDDPTLHELPPLVIDGIPTPVEKMTQAQLRAFIPLMLKYATGRGKPGWGKDSTKPPWWPENLPWANVRSDVRSEEEKHRVSWTHALRQMVINCYKYHGREDLLPVFNEEEEKVKTHVQVSTDLLQSYADDEEKLKTHVQVAQFAPTVLQTINNADGTLSIIQVDSTGTILTLADGTQVQAIQSHGDGSDVQTLAEVAASQGHGTIDLSGDGTGRTMTIADAMAQEGQIILTTEDGTTAFPVSAVQGMVTIPVSMYQTVVAGMLQQSNGGTMQVSMAPAVITSNSQEGDTGHTVEVLTVRTTDQGSHSD